MKKNKRIGFTLIEVLIYISIFTTLFFTISEGLKSRIRNQEFTIQKRNISQFIRKIQQYSQYNKREYILDFKITENCIYFIDNSGGKNEIIDKLKISNQISYMTNNKEKNEDFIRKTTEDGNFERGFSIYLLDKEGKRLYYRISTNTINAAKFPIISIYKAKKPIELNGNYLDVKMWEEEL